MLRRDSFLQSEAGGLEEGSHPLMTKSASQLGGLWLTEVTTKHVKMCFGFDRVEEQLTVWTQC